MQYIYILISCLLYSTVVSAAYNVPKLTSHIKSLRSLSTIEELSSAVQTILVQSNNNFSIPGSTFYLNAENGAHFGLAEGVADLESNRKMDINDVIRIASVTKTFTSAAILLLCENGKVHLDDNMKKWFPQYNITYAQDITVRMLLQHTSGIPDYYNKYVYIYIYI